MAEFLAQHQTGGAAGALILSFNMLLTIFGIFQESALNPSTNVADAVITMQQLDAQELEATLKSVATWNDAWRALALERINHELALSLRGSREEGRMWQALADIIRSPDRYTGGQLKLNEETGDLHLPAKRPGQMWRGVPAYVLNDWDQIFLLYLCEDLWAYPVAANYLSQSDFILRLNEEGPDLGFLSKWDRMLLNKALLSVPKQHKFRFATTIGSYGRKKRVTAKFWADIKADLYSENWKTDPLVARMDVPDEHPMQTSGRLKSANKGMTMEASTAEAPRSFPWGLMVIVSVAIAAVSVVSLRRISSR
jgi:hypothetical protein